MSRKEEGKMSQQSRPEQEKNLDDDDDLERYSELTISQVVATVVM